MMIQLDKFESVDPNFAPPVGHNGEPLELFAIERSGPYLVARYYSTTPVEGPKTERGLVDLYLNPEGREVFRITSKLVEPPPPSPTFWQRVSTAWQFVWSP